MTEDYDEMKNDFEVLELYIFIMLASFYIYQSFIVAFRCSFRHMHIGILE